jgi:hypothetical protein
MSNDIEKDWTIMVYMAGDNDLGENLAFSLNAIEGVAGNMPADARAEVNLLAFFDGNSLTAPTYYMDFSKSRRYQHQITPKDNYHKSERRQGAGEPDDHDTDGNSASIDSIKNFVHWCIKNRKCKAKNYALIFSGHSFGFHGTTFLRDNSAGGFMSLLSFRQALEEISELYLDEKKISILGFDSCVMSMLEVGYELKDVAQVLVASEGSLPTSGWGYTAMLNEFIASHGEKYKLSVRSWYKEQEFKECNHLATKKYVKRCAKRFVRAFIKEQKKLALGGRAVDIAAWDLEQVAPIAKSVNALAKKFNEKLDLTEKIHADTLDNPDLEIYQDLKKIIHLAHYESQTYMSEQCVDLKDFCGRLIFECGFLKEKEKEKEKDSFFTQIISQCEEIIGAVDKCVLKSGFCGDSYQFSNGISIYFPWSGLTYALTDDRYGDLRFNLGGDARINQNDFEGAGKDWNDFLFNYAMRVTLRPARKNSKNRLSEFEVTGEGKPPIWNKKNPFWSKKNPIWSTDRRSLWKRINRSWDGNSDSEAPGHKDNVATGCKGNGCKGEVGEYLIYFSRFKNYQMAWDISGFSDDKK